MENNTKKQSGGFFNIIKNLFFLLIFLQFLPIIFMNIKGYVKKIFIPKTHVGKITINGFIGNSSFYTKKIKKFLKNPDIKALFIKIDSPGGLPGTAQSVFREIEIFKKEKPVVTLVENVCASAAYYIASGSNHIISPPCALIGSIGVLMQLPNVKELLENWNVKFKIIHSGKFKTAGSPLKILTPEDTQYFQELSDGNYQQFIKDIAQSRNLDINQEKIWANGKIFIGNEALKLKLIDQIGSYSDAVEKIKELADIKTDIKFVSARRPTGLMRLFKAEDEEENNQQPGFSSKVANFLHDVYIKLLAKQTIV